ncbi:uncharacterized protein FA14DRAFT_162756 [Meira miltonrushii]|uniref:CR-type domain-containing protein n=1 Tax=Meira miltonrushii TaxID=1280837 RepID=A0A316V4H8_9BASI|nr:uncharacterized protein FA14DRAFT_162756 [Meira miltonrushii]PWN31391.1 hypothetical protein FA14DRAFT_162756 [Meira miltonrushii]
MSDPSIDRLDRLFANHFGISPMMSDSHPSSQGGSLSSHQATSSYTSSESNSPETPQKGGRELPLGKPFIPDRSQSRGVKNFTSTDSGSGIGLIFDENDRKAKAQQLLNALAELYAAPLVNSGSNSIKTASIYSQNSNEQHERQAQFNPSDISPKSVQSSLPYMQDKQNDSYRNSSSTFGSLPKQTRNTEKKVEAPASEHSEGGDATIWPMEQGQVHEIDTPENVGNLAARRQSKVGTQSVGPMSPLSEVQYRVDAIPRRILTEEQSREELTLNFPYLCEAPHVIMYDDQGIALPPLKYEETSNEERKARKNALSIKIRGKKMHTLIKSMVVLESRSSHWKMIPAAKQKSSIRRHGDRSIAAELPQVPDPWSMNFMHSTKDTLSIKGTARRIFELSESRAYGQCPKCQGCGVGMCGLCKGTEPDECFWCEGSGREKVKAHLKCQPCNGTGKLACKTCKGSLKSTCRTCEGEGEGYFCAYIQIKVRRVDFAPVPVSSVIQSATQQNAESIKEAAIRRTWDAINKLTEASGVKHKHAFRPLAASCSLQTSWSDLVEVHVPQTVKVDKNGHRGLLRSRSLTNLRGQKHHHQQPKMKKYFFVLPCDTDLQPAEIEEDEFELALMPEIRHQPEQLEQQIDPRQQQHDVPYVSAAKSAHQRTQSERVQQHEKGNRINSADVAAWQARVQSLSAFNHLVVRPTSPTSQLASNPGTPDERHAPAAWQHGGGYFGGGVYSEPISPRTAASSVSDEARMQNSFKPTPSILRNGRV